MNLQVVSPTHSMALAAYAVVGLAGITFQSGLANQLIEVWPHGLYVVWATLMLLAGFACFISALIAPGFRDPRNVLRIELVGCLILGIVLGAYEWSLLIRGWDFALTTQLLVMAIGVGAVFRSVQVARDLARIRKSVARESEGNTPWGLSRMNSS